jgi:hypothetical protein
MYAATVTHRRWLRHVKLALEDSEGTAVSEASKPGLSHILKGRRRME